MFRRNPSLPQTLGRCSAFRRYLLLDLAGWVGCLGFGSVALHATGRRDVMVIGAIVGENLAFYGLAFLLDAWKVRSTPRRLIHVLGGLFTEFAPAELLDTALIRPGAMLLGSALVDSAILGMTLGGIGADVVYYGVAMRCRRQALQEPCIPNRDAALERNGPP